MAKSLIKAQHGDWIVTNKGIQYSKHEYFIHNDELFDEHLDKHMNEKTWVNMDDFRSARDIAIVFQQVEQRKKRRRHY